MADLDAFMATVTKQVSLAPTFSVFLAAFQCAEDSFVVSSSRAPAFSTSLASTVTLLHSNFLILPSPSECPV